MPVCASCLHSLPPLGPHELSCPLISDSGLVRPSAGASLLEPKMLALLKEARVAPAP